MGVKVIFLVLSCAGSNLFYLYLESEVKLALITIDTYIISVIPSTGVGPATVLE